MPADPEALHPFSFQIGRMPKDLCKTVFEFFVTRETMPAEYLEFLLQFATGHELSYTPSAIDLMHHYISSKKYAEALKEVRAATLDILEKEKATERGYRNTWNSDLVWTSDSALAWDLALELEKASPIYALEALKIIFHEIPKNQGRSLFENRALDKFCDISLKLFIKGGRKNLKLIENALDISLQRLERACLPAVLIFVNLIEEASGLVIDKNEISKLAPDPELMSSYGEALAIVLSTLTDYIYKTRNDLINKKSVSTESDTASLDFKQAQNPSLPLSLPALGLTGYTVSDSSTALGSVALKGTDKLEDAAAASIDLLSDESSGKKKELEKDSYNLKKSRKFE